MNTTEENDFSLVYWPLDWMSQQPAFLCFLNDTSVLETGMWRYSIYSMKLKQSDKRNPLQPRCRCPRHSLVKVRCRDLSIKWHKRLLWMSCDALAGRLRPPSLDLCAVLMPALCWDSDASWELRWQTCLWEAHQIKGVWFEKLSAAWCLCSVTRKFFLFRTH